MNLLHHWRRSPSGLLVPLNGLGEPHKMPDIQMIFPYPMAYWQSGAACLFNDWQTVASATGDANLGGWLNLTIVQRIPVAILTNTGECAVRCTWYASTAESLAVGEAAIGPRNMAGNEYSFDGAPTQLLFDGGNSGFSITSGQTKVSDDLVFSIDGAKDLLVAFYVNNVAATDGMRRDSALATWKSFWKSGGNEVTTQTKAGYTDGGNVADGMLLVESTP